LSSLLALGSVALGPAVNGLVSNKGLIDESSKLRLDRQTRVVLGC